MNTGKSSKKRNAQNTVISNRDPMRDVVSAGIFQENVKGLAAPTGGAPPTAG